MSPIGLPYVFVFILFCFALIAIDFASPMYQGIEAKPLRVQLQTAPIWELEILPGIGHKMAQRIVEYRKHHILRTPDDLIGVFGLGTRKVEHLRRFVLVEEGAE